MPVSSQGRGDHRDFGPCKVVILAGGFGTRLAEQTDEIPKPMVHVGGRPMLWHILKIYSHYGFNDFLVACGYKAEVIKRFFIEYREQTADLLFDFANNHIQRLNGSIEPWRIACIDTGAQTLTGGRIKRLAPYLNDGTFLLTYGDGVGDVDLGALLKFHRAHGKMATFTAVRRPLQYGHAVIEGSRVTAFTEKPAKNDEWINGGFFAVQREVLDQIEGDESNFELHCLPKLARDGQLMAYRHEGFWHAMDTLRDVRNLNALWSAGAAKWKVWS